MERIINNYSYNKIMPRYLSKSLVMIAAPVLVAAGFIGVMLVSESGKHPKLETDVQIYDVTGDGLEDWVFRDPRTGQSMCWVNLGDDNYKKTSFKLDHKIPYCEVPGVGFYDPNRKGMFTNYSDRTPQP